MRVLHAVLSGASSFKLQYPQSPFNPLNAELNPIRHLLALVGARHTVHVSRIRVKPSRSCLRLLLCLTVTPIPPSTFPSITCFRRHQDDLTDFIPKYFIRQLRPKRAQEPNRQTKTYDTSMMMQPRYRGL